MTLALERNKTPTYTIIGNDIPEHASTIKQEMEKMGADVIIIPKPEDLNVVMVFNVPVNIDTVEMFQRMNKCLQNTS